MKNSKKKPQPNIAIYQVVLGFAGTILVAYLGYLGIRTQVEMPIRTTQTAEAKLTQVASTVSITETPIPTLTPKLNGTPTPSGETFIEDFSKGSKYWELGTEDNDNKTASLSILNNILRWQVIAKKDGHYAMGYPRLPSASNIDVEATLNFFDGSGGG